MQTIGTDMAFPVPGSENNYMTEGLTKREHFAALALQGIATKNDLPAYAALKAVMYADALIEALNA